MKNPNGEEIINFLNSRWAGAVCPLCQGREWNITDKIFELREFNNGDLVLGGPNCSIIPIVPVTCGKCGNTIFINAVSTGLMRE